MMTWSVDNLRLRQFDPGYARQAFEIATATTPFCSEALKGYPISTSKKKRACVVTYRHSGDRLFKNSFPHDPNVNNL
jgi:hypothetical protein